MEHRQQFIILMGAVLWVAVCSQSCLPAFQQYQGARTQKPGGQVVTAKQFSAQWHRQAEGITFAADGALIVADEGAGGKARLTLYPVSGSRQ